MGHIYSQRGSKLTMTTKHKIQENHQIQLVSPSLLFPCGFCCCCVLLLFTFPSFYFPEPRGLSVFFRPLFFNPIALGNSKYSFYFLFSFTISLLIMLKVVVWCMLHVCVCVCEVDGTESIVKWTNNQNSLCVSCCFMYTHLVSVWLFKAPVERTQIYMQRSIELRWKSSKRVQFEAWNNIPCRWKETKINMKRA